MWASNGGFSLESIWVKHHVGKHHERGRGSRFLLMEEGEEEEEKTAAQLEALEKTYQGASSIMWRDKLCLKQLKEQTKTKDGVDGSKKRQTQEYARRKKMSTAQDGILKYML
ncbi:hypothetical protein Droror1_Dr00000025 [Drosera rotundifolia]